MKTSFYCISLVFALMLSPFSTAETRSSEFEKNTLIYSFPDADWFPIYYAKPGELCDSAGVFLEILDKIFAKHSNLQYNCKKSPWKRAQISVEQGQSDFLITVPTDARSEYAKASKEPVFQLYLNVYTYFGHPKTEEIRKIKSVDDILRMNLVAVTNRGNGWHKANIEEKGVTTQEVNEDEIIPKFLVARRADIMIDAVIPMNYKINKLGLADNIVLTQARFGPINFHLLVGRESKYREYFDELDATISQLKKDGTFDEIQTRYSKLNNKKAK